MGHQYTFDPLAAARAYVAGGLSVIPIAHGTKEPAGDLLPRAYEQGSDTSRPTWRPFQERLPHDHELARWYSRGNAGVGIVCGAVSGGLVVIDLEAPELYERWRANAAALVDEAILDSLPVVASGRGRHVYLRMTEPIGNRKLAMRQRQVLAETRGQGGYIIAPPSAHPSGALYTLLSGDLCAVPLLADDVAQALFDAARALAPVAPHPADTGAPPNTGGDVIGVFNREHTIIEILEARGYRADGRGRYIRPDGSRSSVSIVNDRSVHYNTADPLYSEAPGGGNYSHTPFSAWCVLEHGSDVKAAVREAARQLGLTRPPPSAGTVLAEAGRVLGLGDERGDTYPYFLSDDSIWMHQKDRDGTDKAPVPLCNFVARITAETLVDDGEHPEEWYTVTATCQGRTRTIELRRAEFEAENALSRILAALGARARVNPRVQPRFVLDAIKVFSQAVQERVIHTHTGWVDGRYRFVNGYVDVEGWHPDAGCQLPRRLASYRLAPEAGDETTALALLDKLLTLAPPQVMVPLVGAVLLALIMEGIDAAAPMVHLTGPTGTHKTSITCAAMALVGAFVPMKPTDTWTSTSNSIQRLGWHLKDAPMLLDDYKTAQVKPHQVTFLLQNYGDNTARGRLDANSEVRAVYPMRCVLISSGEDQPEGEASTLARILTVPVARRAVDRTKLTAIQRGAAHLHMLTVDYLRWLAGRRGGGRQNEQYEAARGAILAQLEDAIDQGTNPGRIASNVAMLSAAWEPFGQFLSKRGHWSPEQVDAWLATCKRELLALARAQLNLTTQERHSQIFLETVRGLLASNRSVLQKLDDDQQEVLTTQVVIGGRDGRGTYLMTNTAYDEVCKQLRATGRPITFSLRALSQMLHQDGLLQSTEGTSHVVKRRINGLRPYCWHLAADIFTA